MIGQYDDLPEGSVEVALLDLLVERSSGQYLPFAEVLQEMVRAALAHEAFDPKNEAPLQRGDCSDGLRLLLLFGSQVVMRAREKKGSPDQILGSFLSAIRLREDWLLSIQAFGTLLFSSQVNVVSCTFVEMFLSELILDVFCTYPSFSLSALCKCVRELDEVGKIARAKKHFRNGYWNCGHKCKPKSSLLMPQQYVATFVFANFVFRRFLDDYDLIMDKAKERALKRRALSREQKQVMPLPVITVSTTLVDQLWTVFTKWLDVDKSDLPLYPPVCPFLDTFAVAAMSKYMIHVAKPRRSSKLRGVNMRMDWALYKSGCANYRRDQQIRTMQEELEELRDQVRNTPGRAQPDRRRQAKNGNAVASRATKPAARKKVSKSNVAPQGAGPISVVFPHSKPAPPGSARSNRAHVGRENMRGSKRLCPVLPLSRVGTQSPVRGRRNSQAEKEIVPFRQRPITQGWPKGSNFFHGESERTKRSATNAIGGPTKDAKSRRMTRNGCWM